MWSRMKTAIVFDKSGTILNPCRVLFDFEKKEFIYHVSTLNIVKKLKGFLLNIENNRFKISYSFSYEKPKINIEEIRRVYDILKRIENEALNHCHSEIGTCKALILDEKGNIRYAVGLGGRIYDDAKYAIDKLREISDIFIATGNCKKATLKCAKILGIKEKFVIYNATPKEKMELIKLLKLFYGCVIMIGNDINDIMALREANVSIFINRDGNAINFDTDYVISSLYELPRILLEIIS
ncbi:MAG: HAD family hydrolase [Candidatus Methanomethylicia archaeon]|jgi:Cu+-exporting ATPase|nr:HAD family hydrolase [Candidatus Methanomethylicia archaeon]